MSRFVPITLLILAGCGPTSQRPCAVEGEVVLDGKPLHAGTIQLFDPAGQLAGDGGTVADGRFAFSASAGPKRVEIRASKMMPGPVDSQGRPDVREYLPARYHDQSKLTVDIHPGGPNRLRFDLTSSDKP
ncbi:hypothetical protein [Gemmata sp.]|uniref:hypothetical protein n=1 Tax=Gemmata sp. TaxID=1914242 RepID=UPI003F7102AA